MTKTMGYRRILLATDGSAAAGGAARHAVEFARLSGAHLDVLFVVDVPDALKLGVYASDALHELRRDAVRAVERIADEAAAAGVQATPHVADGAPGEMILLEAEKLGSDLIVLGSAGESPIERLLLGSTSDYVLSHSRLPVLIVRITPET